MGLGRYPTAQDSWEKGFSMENLYILNVVCPSCGTHVYNDVTFQECSKELLGTADRKPESITGKCTMSGCNEATEEWLQYQN